MSELVYLKLKLQKNVNQKEVFLKDVAAIWCEDKQMQQTISDIKLFTFGEVSHERRVIDVFALIDKICAKYENVWIENIGQTNCVVEYYKKKNNSFEGVKIFLVCVITFIGGCYGIMAYNNDVGTIEIFSKMYEIMGARILSSFKLIEVSYAVGLFLGIVVFYDHFAGHKISNSPTPIEVEMDKYDGDIANSVIQRKESDDT